MTNNTAGTFGGGIYFNSINYLTAITLKQTNITNNTGSKGGGGIRFQYIPLVIDSDTTIIKSNKGFFGSDLAGYPIKLKERQNVTKKDYSWFTSTYTSGSTSRILADEATSLTTNLISG